MGKERNKQKDRVYKVLHWLEQFPAGTTELINDGAIHNRNTPVFPLLSETKTDTNKYLIDWLKKAGIGKHITWHATRRTCPSLLHEMGVDIYTIQKICGHSRVQTTAIYTQVSDNSLRKAVNSLPKLEI
jgi:site-specific recombinase XerD